MSDFIPSTPIQLQIRKIIYENFNDPETKFTNDEIFEKIKQVGDLDKSWIIDDLEPFINQLCSVGLARNIAQNFTTIWLKLFDPMTKHHCDSCNFDVYIGESEKKECPNPLCNAEI